MPNKQPDSAKCFPREAYLQFIQTLYNRTTTQAQNAGITKWALVVALVTIIWQSFPLFHLFKQKESLTYILGIYVHTHITIFSLLIFYYCVIYGTNLFTKFDYRIKINPTTNKERFFATIPVFIFPLFAGVVFIFRGTPIPGNQSLILKIDSWIIGILALLIYGSYIYDQHFRKTTGYPSHLSIEKGVTKLTRKINNFMVAIFSMLLVGNIYGCYLLFFKISSEDFKNIGLLGFNLTIMSYVIFCFLISVQGKSSLAFLAKLERDIILHDIENEEIKKRLEENIFGQEFGSWVFDKLTMIRNKGKNFLSENEAIDDRIKEFEAISPKLQYERKGRLKEFHDKFESNFTEYSEEIRKLINWINMLRVNENLLDSYLLDIINNTIRDLEKLDQEVMSSSKIALGKIEKVVQDL